MFSIMVRAWLDSTSLDVTEDEMMIVEAKTMIKAPNPNKRPNLEDIRIVKTYPRWF